MLADNAVMHLHELGIENLISQFCIVLYLLSIHQIHTRQTPIGY